VTITGSNFTGATMVRFGSTAATSFTAVHHHSGDGFLSRSG
jgi:hypothetical protein